MTLHKIGDVLRGRWLPLAATALIAAVVAAGTAFAVGPSFTATSRILLTRPQSLLSGSEGLLTTQNLNLQALTYAQVVVSQDFVENALRQAGVDTSGVSVTAAVEQNTAVLVVKTQASSAGRADAAARAVDAAVSDDVGLAGRSSGAPAVASRLLQSPHATRSSTGVLFAGFVGFALGLAVAVTFALLSEGP